MQTAIKQVPGAEVPPVGLAHLVTGGRRATGDGTLALFSHLISGREPHLRGGGVGG